METLTDILGVILLAAFAWAIVRGWFGWKGWFG